MGRERTGKRQRLFLYIAGLGFLILSGLGCSSLPLMQKEQDELMEAEWYLGRGEFGSAAAMNRKAAKEAYFFQLDRVFYQEALILAHPNNPRHDYEKAMTRFKMIIEKYPESRLKEEARVWVMVLTEVEDREKRLSGLGSDIKTLQNRLSEKEQELLTLQKKHIKLTKELKELRKQFEQLKEVDLGIEVQKRKAVPQ